jgi:hypothetical protein
VCVNSSGHISHRVQRRRGREFESDVLGLLRDAGTTEPQQRYAVHISVAVLAALLCCTGTAAQAAGLNFIDVPADAEGPALAGAAWYPCALPAGQVTLRSIAVPALRDCPVAGVKLPLIIISHGTAGWFGGHHDAAAALADVA